MVVLYPLESIDAPTGNGSLASEPLHDPVTIRLLQSEATNVVQTAASRLQCHLCPGIFTDASLNIIGNAGLASSAGPVVFSLCWSRKGGTGQPRVSHYPDRHGRP